MNFRKTILNTWAYFSLSEPEPQGSPILSVAANISRELNTVAAAHGLLTILRNRPYDGKAHYLGWKQIAP